MSIFSYNRHHSGIYFNSCRRILVEGAFSTRISTKRRKSDCGSLMVKSPNDKNIEEYSKSDRITNGKPIII